MKTRSLIFAIVLSAAVGASAQTFNPERKYKADDSDAYTMKMTLKSSMGDLGINMDMKQTVKKVYDNGDADIETAVENLIVNMAGNEMKPPAGPPTTMKLNKFGLPVSAAAKGAAGMNFSRFGTYFGEKELKVGETYSFDQVDKDNPKNHAKGTAKLLSIENGKAKIAVSIDNYTGDAPKPMHLDGTVVSDATSGKMLRFEGKASNLPSVGGAGMTVESAEFTIEHK